MQKVQIINDSYDNGNNATATKTNMETKTALEIKKGKDTKICKLLKTKELRYHIGMTATQQSIDLVFNPEEQTYTFFVDASPMNNEDGEHDAMLKMYNLV